MDPEITDKFEKIKSTKGFPRKREALAEIINEVVPRNCGYKYTRGKST